MPDIICPKCQHHFEPSDAIREEVESRLRGQMADWQKNKEAAYIQKELQLQSRIAEVEKNAQAKLEAEKKKLSEALGEQLRKELSGDYEVQLKNLQAQISNSEEKLKDARNREAEFLRKELDLKNKEEELEITLQRRLIAERDLLAANIREDEATKSRLKDTETQMRFKEYEAKFEQQKVLLEEMRRKAEQGSMQTQGEVQEILLEELLRGAFPFDEISEVGKGVRGADCIQTVRNKLGQPCGKIIFESKRTQAFSNDWIDKLKADLRSQGADIGIIVTQTMPKDMDRFGEKEGIYVCSFSEVRAMVALIRDGMVKMAMALKTETNKGDKMAMLYGYLTSSEFGEQWSAIREGFHAMRNSINKERENMERLWKAREKQLEKVMLNMMHFKGTIEGISGQDFDLNLLDNTNTPLLDA